MFEEFPKIARLSREVVVTEKLDGTNAQVFVWDYKFNPEAISVDVPALAKIGDYAIAAGSRNKYVTPEADNYGFAGWVKRNAEELVSLGEGRHYGEYWGAGIQRKYGLDRKKFSLFNVARWADDRDRTKYPQDRPACCDVVPVLYRGPFDTAAIDAVLANLRLNGSTAAPGFKDPEGVVVWHEAARTMFKKTVIGDESPKSAK